MQRNFPDQWKILFLLTATLIVRTPVGIAAGRENGAPFEVAKRYLLALYSRDYRAAYPCISEKDRKEKELDSYLRENPSFSGAALRLARRLGEMIEFSAVRTEVHNDQARVDFHVKLPDANASPVRKLLLDYDAERLDRLSDQRINEIEGTLEKMKRAGTLPMIEGEDGLDLIEEKDGWRVLVNWAGAIRVRFGAESMAGLPWEFRPLQEIILAKPGETLQAVYWVKNLSRRAVTAKARHTDSPREIAEKHLQVIQCFCFIQQTLRPGEEKEFPLVFRIDGDIPKSVQELRIVYEFYPIEKFPER